MNDYQKNILNNEMFYKGTSISNIGGVVDLSVNISYEDTDMILQEIIRKTPSLRIRLNENKELYEYEYVKYDVKRVSIYGEYEEAFCYAEKSMRVPFSPLFNNNLFVIEYIEYNSGCMLYLKLHHLLGDAAAIALICKKFEQGYDALIQGKDFVCCNVPVEYSILSSEFRKKSADYFSKKLTSVELVKLSEKESRDCSAERLKFTMPLYKKGMTSYFIAAIYIYASIVMNSSKVVLGLVLGNRKKQERQMIGMFANTLPLVLEFEDGSFEELSRCVGREIFNLMKCSSYSFDDLKKYNNITSNIFDISVSYRYKDFLPEIKIGKIEECFSGCVDIPIRISAEEEKDELNFSISYNKSIFQPEFIENMGNAIITILHQGFEHKQVSNIDILTEFDKKLYKDLNETDKLNSYQDVIECFKDHLTEREVVVWEEGSLNGYELERRARKIAAYIQAKKVYRIGIKMERSHEMIESIMGILMAGAAFMIVSDIIPEMDKYCDMILEKSDVEAIYGMEYDFIDMEYSSQSTAYMVCTSGTTGKQKCIEISRKSLMCRLEWADNKYGLTGSILQKTVNTFDVSVWEMLSVIFGARLCLLQEGFEKLPDKIASAMLEYEIEKVHFVPSVLRRFIRYVKLNGIVFQSLQEVYVSGEKLERTLVDEFFEVFSGNRLINLYGPAECTIDVTFYECKEGEIPLDVPIGHPVDNTKIYILNDNNKCMPANTIGEICVFGDLVGKGYVELESISKKEQTGVDEKQCQESGMTSKNNVGYCDIGGVRAYRTGDMGKLDFDGNIYISGRKDNQVKLRGIRLNLSEIKNIILKCDGIVDVEVIKHNNRLECYYCGNADINIVRKELLEKASAYAVPSVFKKLDVFPLTNSGKVDVKALRKMSEEKVSMENEVLEDYENKMSILEKELLKEVSKYIDANIDDNLFDVGLDSVSVLDIVCYFQEKGYDIDFSDFYENLTIREIAANLQRKKYYTFLKKHPSDSVMICFPYAGGEPQNALQLVNKISCNVIGIYGSAFPADATVEEIAVELKNILPLQNYKRIYIYGHCAGCMTALEFAYKIGRKVNGIILVTPTVKKNNPLLLFSPWRIVPDCIIKLILKNAGSNFTYTKAILDKFRNDTDRYFRYTPHVYDTLREDCCISVIFGESDIFTRNRNKIIKRLKRYIAQSFETYCISGGKHFLSETNCNEVYQIIKSEYAEL